MPPRSTLSIANLLVASGLVWILAGAPAQVPAQPSAGPVIRVDVRQVLVPVIVTDGKGHHITGLKASDFHILEDGVAQEIAAFSTDTAPSSSAMAAFIARPRERAPRSLSFSRRRRLQKPGTWC
jgi:hypothetical protein